jgi:two-component system, sensor histidine kinase LadS
MYPRSFTVNLGFIRFTIHFFRTYTNRPYKASAEEVFSKEHQINKELEHKVRERTQELMVAYEKISQMNLLLYANNKKLEVNIKKAIRDRINQKEFSFENFQNTYPDEKSCLLYLSQLKWGRGYECKKCHSLIYAEWKSPFSRRCRKCKYIESATAYTCFHAVKFPLLKAFYMLFLLNSRKSINIEELSRILDLSTKTCSAFKAKIQIILKKLKNKNPELPHIILYDEEEQLLAV